MSALQRENVLSTRQRTYFAAAACLRWHWGAYGIDEGAHGPDMPLDERVHGLQIALLVAIQHHIGNILDRLADQKQKPGCPVVVYEPLRLNRRACTGSSVQACAQKIYSGCRLTKKNSTFGQDGE